MARCLNRAGWDRMTIVSSWTWFVCDPLFSSNVHLICGKELQRTIQIVYLAYIVMLCIETEYEVGRHVLVVTDARMLTIVRP